MRQNSSIKCCWMKSITKNNVQGHDVNKIISVMVWRCGYDFIYLISKPNFVIDVQNVSSGIFPRWMPQEWQDHIDKSTLCLVMAWCRQPSRHYLNQCWQRPVKSNIINRPQWVNLLDRCNSSPPSAAYMRRRTESSSVQVMASRLLGAKPLLAPMLTYCQLDP